MRFQTFDVSHAKCFDPVEREISAQHHFDPGFGGLDQFNAYETLGNVADLIIRTPEFP